MFGCCVCNLGVFVCMFLGVGYSGCQLVGLGCQPFGCLREGTIDWLEEAINRFPLFHKLSIVSWRLSTTFANICCLVLHCDMGFGFALWVVHIICA